MTQLVITPKVSDKTARFNGTVAAGEHVAVTIKGGAGWLGEDDGANLTLLVIDRTTHRVAAVFPRPAEMLAEGETADAWDSTQGDLTCTLDLNTLQMVNAARHMLCVPVLFVLGDKDNPRTLYFRDEYRVEFWPERLGDTPYDLDKWPGQIDEWEEIVANFGATLSSHVADAVKHVTAEERATWQAKYAKPGTGIPKGDLASDVQTSLGKADTALQAHQSLDAYVNGGDYDSTSKKILLKHGSTTIAEIDATDFIKDGMVDSVEISGGNLVISFNTDAGVEDIEIPLTDIFNPANYYDKTAADGRFVQKEAGKGLFSGSYDDLTDKPTIPASVSVDATLTQSGAAADAKATGDALRSGFTEWTFSGNVSPGVTYTVDITEYEGPVYIASMLGSDGTAETTGVDSLEVESVSFDGSGITATRHLVTPTKTSQLTNDGDGTSPFAKVSQLPDVSGLATKAELPYPFVPATVTQEGPQLPASAFPIAFSYTGDPPSEFSFGAEDVAISQNTTTGEWRVFSDSFGFVICVYTSAGAFSAAGTNITNLTFGGESTPPNLEFPNVLTITPRTVATYTADSTAASFSIAIGTGTTGAARDCVLVVDCTASGAVAPSVAWGANFHPRGDAEEIAPVAGVRNVFYISEYAAGEFVVGGWHEEVA